MGAGGEEWMRRAGIRPGRHSRAYRELVAGRGAAMTGGRGKAVGSLSPGSFRKGPKLGPLSMPGQVGALSWLPEGPKCGYAPET